MWLDGRVGERPPGAVMPGQALSGLTPARPPTALDGVPVKGAPWASEAEAGAWGPVWARAVSCGGDGKRAPRALSVLLLSS